MPPRKLVPLVNPKALPAAFRLDVSERAAAKIRQALAGQPATAGVRIGLVEGVSTGCCQETHVLELEAAPGPGEVVVAGGPVPVFVNPVDAARLDGVLVDYVEGPGGSGFHIENPHFEQPQPGQHASCVCGRLG